MSSEKHSIGRINSPVEGTAREEKEYITHSCGVRAYVDDNNYNIFLHKFWENYIYVFFYY